MEETCKNCPYESVINELKRDADRNSDQHREFYKKFNDQEKAQAIIEERYSNILVTLAKVESGLEELKEKPTKRWDTAVSCIITGIIGAILGAIFKSVFGG